MAKWKLGTELRHSDLFSIASSTKDKKLIQNLKEGV